MAILANIRRLLEAREERIVSQYIAISKCVWAITYILMFLNSQQVAASDNGVSNHDVSKSAWQVQLDIEKRHQAEMDYASSVTDAMLTYILDDAWESGKRLACVSAGYSIPPRSSDRVDPLHSWIDLHLASSSEAEAFFGFDNAIKDFDLLNEIAKEHATNSLFKFLQPARRAYNRAKLEEAERVLAIAVAAKRGRQFCSVP